MSDKRKDAQQEPDEDSALQTPQPDQPHPPGVSNRREDSADDSPPVEVNVNVDNPTAPGSGNGDEASD